MEDIPTESEMAHLGAYTVNVYIEYLDIATGDAVEIMPDGGMVYETDSAAVANAVAEYLITMGANLPPVGQLEVEDLAMNQILETS